MNKILRTIIGVAILGLAVWGAITLTNIANKDSKENESTTSTTQQGNDTIAVNLIIEAEAEGIDRSFDLKVEKDSTVFEVMEEAKDVGLAFDFSKSDFGVLIEEIEGIRNSSENGKYWTYYINGEMAQKGVGEQKIRNNDQVIWLYQSSAI